MDINAHSDNGGTLLRGGDLNNINMLLVVGAMVSDAAADQGRLTALAVAPKSGHVSVVRSLVSANANRNAATEYGHLDVAQDDS